MASPDSAEMLAVLKLILSEEVDLQPQTIGPEANLP